MAQIDISDKAGAVYFGAESTFGTTPTMARIFPRVGTMADVSRTVIAVDTQKERVNMRDKSVLGLKNGTINFTIDHKIDTTRLTSAATPASTTVGLLLKSFLGGESAFAGSTIQASSTASSIITATGHGSRFPVGSVFLCDVGDVPEVVISKAVSTDTVTPLFNLSATPTSTQDVINCHNYFVTDQNSLSSAFQFAMHQSTSLQWTLNGCVGKSLSLDLGRDSRLAWTMQFDAGNFTGPSSQSISTAVATDPLTGPVANIGALCLLQSLTTTTRVHVPFHSIELNMTPNNMHVEEVGGETNGRIGTQRFNGFDVNATVTIRSDIAWITNFDAGDDLVLVFAVPSGSGATKRWTGFVLYCTIESRPQSTVVDGRRMTVLNLRGRHNTMQSAVTTDLALSPLVIFEG
jgi:hypothetical protein